MSDPTPATPVIPPAPTPNLFHAQEAAQQAATGSGTAKTTVATKIETFAAEVEQKIVTEYGDFERALIAHPKTTFFFGIAVAFIFGDFVGHLF